jgi:hypothetical protein
LIETNLDRFLVINEKKLADYLAQIATTAGYHRGSRDDSFHTRPALRQHSAPSLLIAKSDMSRNSLPKVRSVP